MQMQFNKVKQSNQVPQDHVAIMKKSWGLIEKILNGQKTIESRWYKARFAHWDKIKPADVVYFKNSGDDVTAKAEVTKVLQFDDLNKSKVLRIINKYWNDLGFRSKEYSSLYDGKKYCILIFLQNAVRLRKPFAIDKTGYGNACAWMCVGDIASVKKS